LSKCPGFHRSLCIVDQLGGIISGVGEKGRGWALGTQLSQCLINGSLCQTHVHCHMLTLHLLARLLHNVKPLFEFQRTVSVGVSSNGGLLFQFRFRKRNKARTIQLKSSGWHLQLSFVHVIFVMSYYFHLLIGDPCWIAFEVCLWYCSWSYL